MDFPVLTKPWRDLARYKEARLKEAVLEAELALEFLEEGLVRNAAEKAFQAWKAYMGYLLADYREELKALFPGSRRIRLGEDVVEVADAVISLVPTSRMAQLAAFLSERGVEDAVGLTAAALQLHRYQYNGPDPEGYFGDIPDDRTAAVFICRIAAKLLPPEK
ncbi:MAG: PaREP1 family protein, partial [Pyrobaculum sp.]